MLSKRPIDVPRNWTSRANRAESQSELESLRRCVNRGQPFGSENWVERMTKPYALDLAFGPHGRHPQQNRKQRFLTPLSAAKTASTAASTLPGEGATVNAPVKIAK
jgi:hypothetical protein